MRPNQYFVWSAEYGNYLDIQLDLNLGVQARHRRAAIELFKKHFMPAKPMGNRLSFYGKAVLRNDHSTDYFHLSLFSNQRCLEPIHL